MKIMTHSLFVEVFSKYLETDTTVPENLANKDSRRQID